MNRTIWKYKLEIETTNTILMPKRSEILSVGVQNNKPILWALIYPDEEEKETKVIEMFGTGENIYFESGINRNFLGTIQPFENGMSFAFHIFERY